MGLELGNDVRAEEWMGRGMDGQRDGRAEEYFLVG
jgi:hypothetical protein